MTKTIIVSRTGQGPLRVRGEIIGSYNSSLNNASPSYSGSPGRAQEIQVIKGAGGKFIAAIHHKTQWDGEHDTDEAAVFPSLKQAIRYLADHVPAWMIQELMAELGEDAVEDIKQ